MDLNETIRRLVMAGVGAVSYTFEKSKDLADTLVKKGEETAAENNVSYEQVRDQVAEQLKNLSEKIRQDISKASFDELLERCDDLSNEQRAILMDRLAHPLKEEEKAVLRFLNQTDYQKTVLLHRGSTIPSWGVSAD